MDSVSNKIKIGIEASGVVERKKLKDPAKSDILTSASSILTRCISPSDKTCKKTGLVVGYVQSGKTLSFTTVIAMARDSGYRLIITIAGTSTPLVEQSTNRLRKDLNIDDSAGHLRWVMYKNPANNDSNCRQISQCLEEWRDPNVPQAEKPTVIITVMKNHKHLGNLTGLLNKLNLTQVPTLIIDDEADQASLNTMVSNGKESPTYKKLLELRDALPLHAFLQYTATPQAPLLINIIDSLSPDFVEVLVPGGDYVGGKSFFLESSKLVRVIPASDVPSEDSPLTEPPASLLQALRVFIVGVAVGVINGINENNLYRSMLVHPARETTTHMEYRVWIGRIFEEWKTLCKLPDNDSDKSDFLREFQDAYNDLEETNPNFPSFLDVINILPRALRKTAIEEVNASAGSRTPSIEWGRSYGWILIGGQALDRGFTVEGLTVTYMPRGTGVGNADTIQQRGRFFGYKRGYLGFCRIYLEADVLKSFKDYVSHEEEMRKQLQKISVSGSPLSDWKRAFVLEPDLKPCRRNVINFEYVRGNYANKWFEPKIVLSSKEIVVNNAKIVRSFLNKLTLNEDDGSSLRESTQKHLVARDVLLSNVVENLIIPFRFVSPKDTSDITGVLLQLSNALEKNQFEKCTIFHMSPNYQRFRTVRDNGSIPVLFMGAAPVNPKSMRGTIYPGDSHMRDDDLVTIQVHFVDLKQEDVIVEHCVPIITIWIPKRMGVSWITQDQSQ